MQTGQSNLSQRNGAALQLNTARASHSASAALPPALLHKTAENINWLTKPLIQKNWMQAFADTAIHQPNLSKIVSALDMLLPRSPNAETECLGFAFKGNEEFEGNQPTAMRMKIAENGCLYQQGTSAKPKGQTGGIFQRFTKRESKASNQEPTLKLEIDSKLEAKGEITYAERLKVIQKLVCFALDKEAKSAVLVERNGHVDIEAQTCNNILQSLLPNSDSQQPTNWLDRIARALTPREDETDNTNVSCLSDKQIQRVLKLHPTCIELVSALDLLTLPCKKRSIQSKETFPIFEQEDFIFEVGEKLADGQIYSNTLINNLSRSMLIDQPDFSFEDSTQTQNAGYIYKPTSDSQMAFENKGLLLTFLAQQAGQQITFTEPSALFEFSDLFPMHVLKLVSNLNKTQIPDWILANHNSIHTARQEHKAEQAAKKLADENERAQQKQKDKVLKAQRRQENLAEGIPERFVDDFRLIDLINKGSNNQRIEQNTYDIQLPLSELEIDCVKTTLNNHFTQINMAHNSRGLRTIKKAQEQNKSPYFLRDNQCWNRATWLSVIEQVTSGDDIAKRISEAQFNDNKTIEKLQLVLKTVVDGYLLADHIEGYSRLHFLHHGEEASLSQAPAHFRTGQSIPEFCKEFRLDDIIEKHPDLFKKRDSATTYNVETQLISAVFALASGVHESLQEVKQLKYGMHGSMATSDIPAAVHRALGLPCIIIENNRYQNGMNLRVAGPNNHEFHELLSRLPKNMEGQPRFTTLDLETLLLKGSVPIIHLESINPGDGHFTVYLPNSTELAKQMNFLASTLIPHNNQNKTL